MSTCHSTALYIVKELTTLRKNSSSAGVKLLASFAAASGEELAYTVGKTSCD